jgi:hypothetical protein
MEPAGKARPGSRERPISQSGGRGFEPPAVHQPLNKLAIRPPECLGPGRARGGPNSEPPARAGRPPWDEPDAGSGSVPFPY